MSVPGAAFELGTDGATAIVVGYDGSDPARDALAFAAGMARRQCARLHVCFVVTIPALTGASAAVAGPIVADADDRLATLRAEVEPAMRQLGVDAAYVWRQGDAPHELEAYAELVRADLLVVGRSRSRGHAVLGSVAVALAKKAGRPVVVVP